MTIQLAKSVCEIVFKIVDSVIQPEGGSSQGQDDNNSSENDENNGLMVVLMVMELRLTLLMLR